LADSFINVLSEAFALSKGFSKIKNLNLRGYRSISKEELLTIINSCDSVAHINLSFLGAVE